MKTTDVKPKCLGFRVYMVMSDLKLKPAEAISTILVGIGLGAVAAAFPEVRLQLAGWAGCRDHII